MNEPASGYLWTNLARHHKSLYHFGEYISTEFCGEKSSVPKDRSPLLGTPEADVRPCERNSFFNV